jgi:hypothetical protein
MGLKVLQIVGDREALAVECDDPAHGMKSERLGLIAVHTPTI